MKTNITSDIVVGLGFGDEGKGSMTDFLCRHRDATLVVRYNGGSQAAHNVVTPDGRHHTFSQIGSGAFVPRVKTIISRYMLWDPFLLALEAAELSPKLGEHALNRHYIDERAIVITPFHAAANRLKEWARGHSRHGSCGKGIGETMCDTINHPHYTLRSRDLSDPCKSLRILRSVQAQKLSELEETVRQISDTPDHLLSTMRVLTDPEEPFRIAGAYKDLSEQFNIVGMHDVNSMIRDEKSIFEGAQGVLLDEWYGFHPYTTWSITTPNNAFSLLKEAGFGGEVRVVGIVRSYGTRHGAGPFVTEQSALKHIHPGEHNSLNDWQGSFRFGGFDGVALRYAIECIRKVPVNMSIALTHADVFERVKAIPLHNAYLLRGDTPTVAFEEAVMVNSLLKVSRIIPKPHEHDLAYQTMLTESLMQAAPADPIEVSSLDQLIAHIESTTMSSVDYVSFGPKSSDKQVLQKTAIIK